MKLLFGLWSLVFDLLILLEQWHILHVVCGLGNGEHNVDNSQNTTDRRRAHIMASREAHGSESIFPLWAQYLKFNAQGSYVPMLYTLREYTPVTYLVFRSLVKVQHFPSIVGGKGSSPKGPGGLCNQDKVPNCLLNRPRIAERASFKRSCRLPLPGSAGGRAGARQGRNKRCIGVVVLG